MKEYQRLAEAQARVKMMQGADLVLIRWMDVCASNKCPGRSTTGFCCVSCQQIAVDLHDPRVRDPENESVSQYCVVSLGRVEAVAVLMPDKIHGKEGWRWVSRCVDYVHGRTWPLNEDIFFREASESEGESETEGETESDRVRE
jgi:hypothetical protein